jgi:paraquat-inducible protein A
MVRADPSTGARAVGAWRGCDRCGAVQAPRPGAAVLRCRVCGSELERRTGRSLGGALAFSSATLLLLLPANLAPFLQTGVLGAVRVSRLASGPVELWREGWPALGVLVALVVVVAPLVRFGLLTAALGALRLGGRAAWIGPVFRWADRLQPWAMADVAVLALWIAFARLDATVPTELGLGGVCFIGAGLTSLFTRALLDKPAIWRTIRPDTHQAPSPGSLACDACHLLAPAEAEGRPCPRCAARLAFRKPGAAGRAAALTLAGMLLYLPANLFPMATIPIRLEPSTYTVLQGVLDLFGAGLFGLGLLVFTASFAVPLLKLSALAWFLAALRGRSRRALRTKTRLFGVVEEIGRWSMVDPLVIACFVPVMQFNAKLYGQAGPAATAFSGVVVLTMVATRAFDPRLLWDAARRSP